eukprot:802099-Amphidinium_carterae.1
MKLKLDQIALFVRMDSFISALAGCAWKTNTKSADLRVANFKELPFDARPSLRCLGFRETLPDSPSPLHMLAKHVNKTCAPPISTLLFHSRS